MNRTGRRDRVDVVIVGAGPTGLTAAHLCAQVGLSAIVLERREGPQRSPAAHVVNARTFEIWRQCGVDMGPISAACASPADAGKVHWVTKLGGEIIGSLPFEQQGDDMLAITPTPLRNLSQHRLEPLLQPPDGADGSDGSVRYQHAWTNTTKTDRGLVVDVTSPDGNYEIEATYVLAADGAGSPVRRWTGIESIGPRSLQSFVMIHFRANLREFLGAEPGILYFLADPASGGTFVCHNLDSESVYMHRWNPEKDPVENFTPPRCSELVRAAMARNDISIEILGTSTWHMSAQIAERYQDGNVFLVGDAAHRFPPTGGLGLNTGVADAHNLVWKLGAIKAGWGSADLLHTYEIERKPVAQFNCDQSLANAFKLIEVPIALGASPDIEASTLEMNSRLQDPDQRAAIETAIANQAIHFDLLGLQLGHSYTSPLVISDGTEAPVLAEPARDYVPSTRPGGRLPHAWLSDGRSTLDLIDPAIPTILTSEGSQPPLGDGPIPFVSHQCPGELWRSFFGLGHDDCLIVRPDQHIAYRGRSAGAAAGLTQLFYGSPSLAFP